MVDPLKFYELEHYLFEEVHKRFHSDHSIGAFELFSIVIWKANRAKSRIACRLRAQHDNLESAARELSGLLYRTPTDERLRILMKQWGFLLPMASAILTVLWPDEFTVYDRRVCDELGSFHRLASRSYSDRVWVDYRAYCDAVRNAAPKDLSLRDKDRYLWGRSAAQQLERDLRGGFRPRPAGSGLTRPSSRRRA